MADLITNADLAGRLKKTVEAIDTDAGDSACRHASGWLRSATGLTTWPDPVPDDLWGWALELAVMVYQNPELLEEQAVGGTTSRWGILRLRVEQILEAAHKAYNAGSQPKGSFPDAATWPDPPAISVGPTPASYLSSWGLAE